MVEVVVGVIGVERVAVRILSVIDYIDVIDLDFFELGLVVVERFNML